MLPKSKNQLKFEFEVNKSLALAKLESSKKPPTLIKKKILIEEEELSNQIADDDLLLIEEEELSNQIADDDLPSLIYAKMGYTAKEINDLKNKRKLTNLEISYNEFTKTCFDYKIRFLGDECDKNGLTEPEWNPLIDLATEMSVIPQDVLNKWQIQHLEDFSSTFRTQNKNRSIPILDDDEVSKTESEFIRYHCLSIIMFLRMQNFLESKFPNIEYTYFLGVVPIELTCQESPMIDPKVLVMTMATKKGKEVYPAIVIVPTGYLIHPKDYKILKESLRVVGQRWPHFNEFYGIITNFKMTVFLKYDRDENKYYQWQHAVNFNECFLKQESRAKLDTFYKIWFALLFRSLQTYSKYID